jgi:glycosyltransferase involved in cell wall biosynthesis
MAAKRPDLCVLGYDLRASGVVRNALRIAGAAHAGGLKTELWVARADGPLRAEVPQGVTVVAAEQRAAITGRSLGLARSIRPLAAYLRDKKPRIALSSGNHMHVAASLAYQLSGARRDVSLWARASNATLKTPLSAYLGQPLPEALAGLVDFANGLQYRGFERIIAVCDELAEVLTNDLGVERQRVVVISNGIDVDAIASQAVAPLDHPWFAEGGAPVIVSAGRLSRQKNFGDLIRAAAMVRMSLPVRLVIFGEGPASERQSLEKLAGMLGFTEHLRLPGFEANPYRFMARASVFALSSLWEGASNVVLEALAAGSPVAAYRCPTGIREVLDPLGNESLVNPHDVDGLANAILHRLAHPQEGNRLKAYAGRFTLAQTLDAYVECFSSALSLSRTP